MAPVRLAPFLLLLAYGTAFAAAALGTSLPAFDDHPGQRFRLHHLVARGPAAWAWNPDWWAGYPELQFYPPGYFYLGALLTWGSLGAISVDASYRVLLWLTYLAPGATTFLALTRLTGDGWLALPAAFVALTLSAGVTSGVEGGVHVGMLPARLGWAVLPLLALALLGWMRDAGPGRGPAGGPWLAAPLLAGLVLLHPAHAPAAVVLLLMASGLGPGERRRRAAGTVAALLLAAAMTAFWTVPLLARLPHTRALAWGSLASPSETLGHPLLLLLLGLAAAAWPLARTPADRLLASWPWAAAALVVIDAALLEPAGARWLPADRLVDSVWLAILLAGGAAAATLLRALGRQIRVPAALLGVVAVTAMFALSLPARTLMLWPSAAAWPSLETVARGLRLDDLWTALRAAPPGRALYVRSAVPLVYGPDWWRPHTHVTALTPLHADRGIVGGTFTHPSPVAALVYRGSAGPEPIRRLAEQLDGRSLFGRPLEELDPDAFNAWAARLGVAVVVVLEDDLPRLRALGSNPEFAPAARAGPFRLYTRAGGAAVPTPMAPGRWRISLEGSDGSWVSARVTDYPLWRAEQSGVPLETRRGPAWDLEVRLDGGSGPVDLMYGPGLVETAAALTSALAVAVLAIAGTVVARSRLSR